MFETRPPDGLMGRSSSHHIQEYRMRLPPARRRDLYFTLRRPIGNRGNKIYDSGTSPQVCHDLGRHEVQGMPRYIERNDVGRSHAYLLEVASPYPGLVSQ